MGLTRHQEAAVLRTLSDIADGHIGLYCTVRYYNSYTGARLTEPELVGTSPDRAPAAGFPGAREGRWWELLAGRGWIRPPGELDPPRWQVTDEGRLALAEWSRYA